MWKSKRRNNNKNKKYLFALREQFHVSNISMDRRLFSFSNISDVFLLFTLPLLSGSLNIWCAIFPSDNRLLSLKTIDKIFPLLLCWDYYIILSIGAMITDVICVIDCLIFRLLHCTITCVLIDSFLFSIWSSYSSFCKREGVIKSNNTKKEP